MKTVTQKIMEKNLTYYMVVGSDDICDFFTLGPHNTLEAAQKELDWCLNHTNQFEGCDLRLVKVSPEFI
jgi:hypothetical protein